MNWILSIKRDLAWHCPRGNSTYMIFRHRRALINLHRMQTHLIKIKTIEIRQNAYYTNFDGRWPDIWRHTSMNWRDIDRKLSEDAKNEAIRGYAKFRRGWLLNRKKLIIIRENPMGVIRPPPAPLLQTSVKSMICIVTFADGQYQTLAAETLTNRRHVQPLT